MELATWLCIAFTAMAVTSYLLWCLERLARLRIALAVLSLVCFVTGVALHGYFFSAPNPRPAPLPSAQSQ